MNRVVCVMGAKDRVGGSTVAFQLAKKLFEEKNKVLLLDWDPFHPGDLRWISNPEIPWKDLDDLVRYPKRLDPPSLFQFLEGPENLCALQLAKDSASLPAEESLTRLKTVIPFFDWVIADLGSKWVPPTKALLPLADFLLFVMKGEIPLAHEMRRKLNELSKTHYPKEQVAWIAPRWEENSFLSITALGDFLKLPCLGKEMEEILPILKAIPPSMEKKRTDLSQEEWGRIKISILENIREELEEKGIRINGEANWRPEISEMIHKRVGKLDGAFFQTIDSDRLAQELLDDLLGLGPLERLLQNPGHTEILVNGLKKIYVEEDGVLKEVSERFLDIDSLKRVIERILLPLGRRIDESSPMVDARLENGSRVHIIIPPLAVDGPCISIRKFSKGTLSPDDLLRMGSASKPLLLFLEEAVRNKKNILVSGGTGSGKTTLLNILSSYIPDGERIVTIEEAAELKLAKPHVVRLEARPPNIEGEGAVSIRELVRNSLRMRPDRIVVGECRGAEALDMLLAMNTGHEGSLTTIHANSPKDALSRLETLILFAGVHLAPGGIRERIASAIDLILQVARLENGSRKIVSVVKVVKLEEEAFHLKELFRYENGNFSELPC